MFRQIPALVLATILSTAPALAETPCDQLKEKLYSDVNLKIVKIDAAYSCGPTFTRIAGKKIKWVAGCAILFQNAGFRTDETTPVLAYLDSSNKLAVHWAPIRDGEALGWANSGRYFGADVKTYVLADVTKTGLKLEVSRETARDSLFAPIRRTFMTYAVSCGI